MKLQKTPSANPKAAREARKWLLIDAEGKVLGRLETAEPYEKKSVPLRIILQTQARHLATLSIVADWKNVRVWAQSHGTFDNTLGFTFEDVCISRHPVIRNIPPLSKRGFRMR
jgi:hypothetical protein